MKTAFIVPKQQDGLAVRVGNDGVWLGFESLNGKSYCVNISEDYLRQLGVFSSAVREWRDDMWAAANRLPDGEQQ